MTSKPPASKKEEADDDVIQTFQLEKSRLRGRAVRLGGVLNDILKPHDYPEPVAALTGEMITLTALLSSMLKYEGIFTLQAQGDGPVKMTVADMTSEGVIRGCASFDAAKVKYMHDELIPKPEESPGKNYLAHYLGKGHIAFTVDPASATERYQGIVELKGSSLVECVRHYFTQSEQIGTVIKMVVGRINGQWRGGAIMLQRMPEDLKDMQPEMWEEHWRRAGILLESATEEELLNPLLHSNALLFRLFHEEGVRVYAPTAVKKGCRCSKEKVENMLVMMPEEDLDFMAVDGKVDARCEFCSRNYVFDLKALKGKIKKKPKTEKT